MGVWKTKNSPANTDAESLSRGIAARTTTESSAGPGDRTYLNKGERLNLHLANNNLEREEGRRRKNNYSASQEGVR